MGVAGASLTRGCAMIGMRWSRRGATGILTLRCQQASDRWEEIWQPPHNQTQPADLASCRT